MSAGRFGGVLWDDILWPLSAGLLAAVGLLGALVTWGPLYVGTTLLALGLGLAPMAWAWGDASARCSHTRAVLVLAPSWAMGLLAARSLWSTLPGWTMPVTVALVLTAPHVRSKIVWLVCRVRRGARISKTRWEFHRIVTHQR